MEVTLQNLQNGSYIMELTPWKLSDGNYSMDVSYTNLHNGSYLMEPTQWKLAHGTYTMKFT